MNFDVALGVNQAELNTASQSFYTALYPTLFSGTTQATYGGESFTVSYDVKAAPVFDLSAPADGTALAEHLRRSMVGKPGDPGEIESALSSLADAVPSFSIAFPTTELTLTGSSTTSLDLALTASCAIRLSGSTLTFSPVQVTAPTQSDPVTDWLVQNVVVPQILTLLQTLMSGITIPPIAVSGIALSIPSFGIVDRAVIACANVGGGTPPPPDGTTAWPESPFFAMLGPNVIQALVAQEMASASNRFSNSGSGGDSWAGYDWSYGLQLANPQIGIQDDGSITMTFGLSGGVSGSVEVIYVSLGLDFDANATPDPGVTAGLQVNGSQIDIVTEQVSPFVIIVTPGGSVPDWVLGWLVSAIVTGVTASVTPLITQFLGGIRIDSLQVPTYSISVEGTQLTLVPTGLQVGGSAGYLTLAGNLAVDG